MSAPQTLPVAAHYSAQNSHRSRGHVIVLPGRGDNAELYQRLGSRLAYDGYTVSVVELPALEQIDTAWLDSVELWPDARESGPITLVGSDSGAALAALLADRLQVGTAVLAGIGGVETADDAGDDEQRISTRSSCPVYRGRLADSGADLTASSRQSFGADVVARLSATVVRTPVLAVHGQDDPITSLNSAIASYRELAPEAEIVSVSGGLHDILNDVSHRSVSAEIVQFVEGRGRPVVTHLAQAFEPALAEAVA